MYRTSIMSRQITLDHMFNNTGSLGLQSQPQFSPHGHLPIDWHSLTDSENEADEDIATRTATAVPSRQHGKSTKQRREYMAGLITSIDKQQLLTKFGWLSLDHQLFRCTICVRWMSDPAVSNKNNWIAGKPSLQIRYAIDHEHSSCHATAVQHSLKHSSSVTLPDQFAQQHVRQVPLLHTMVRSAYFIAHHHLPSTMYPHILDLLAQENVVVSPLYRSRQALVCSRSC